MARKASSQPGGGAPADDTWICPICRSENVAVNACTGCGQLRYWRVPGERAESDRDADRATSEDMHGARAPERHLQTEYSWICTNCGTRNVVAFDVCGRCGQKKSGQGSARAQESGNREPVEELPAADTWICAYCGNWNEEPFSVCAKCGQKKAGDEPFTSGAKRDPPGCVAAYAILMWIGGGLVVIGGLCTLNGVVGFGGGLGGAEVILFGLLLLLASINVVTGIGLWQMKKWGWALVVVSQGLGAAAQLLSMAFTVLAIAGSGGAYMPSEPVLLFGNLVSLLVSGSILYWFVKNRELFNVGTEYESVVGPDGKIRQEPVKKTSDTTMLVVVGGGLALIFILICLVLVPMLAFITFE